MASLTLKEYTEGPMSNRLAIVGMACRYPDATSPAELWFNVLAQRRAFRKIPRQRLDLRDYWSADPAAVDSTYVTNGAFLEDYEFDRLRFRVSGDTYRASDMVHWLALDVATAALEDGGFPEGVGLPKESTGVFLGNTLTGEFSRAGVLRQRWPYVRRVIAEALGEDKWEDQAVSKLLSKIEPLYKQPFPAPGPDSLVGGLANTIAGRICNYFDLNGGGYVVDGACCSSQLAVIHACAALLSGDVDVALAGGVDLSMDPFELVGFARAGAIAKDTMRVFDRRPTGFLPGEGCGFVTLMRYEDAVASHHRIYSVIRGWGISSDGAGGMTRPEIQGQALALRRAYRRARLSICDVMYFEAHGTGTEVGDAVELKALNTERQNNGAHEQAVIGSIKANIGHTKAAAGIAGLIKASLAVWHGVLPPTTGCENAHPELCEGNPSLCINDHPKLWNPAAPRRAGVSSMGFGGINTHIVIEESEAHERKCTSTSALRNFFTPDNELLLFAANNKEDLIREISQLLNQVQELSLAEMADLSVALYKRSHGKIRGAVVAATPTELHRRLQHLRDVLEQGITCHSDSKESIFVGQAINTPRIGYLFPGQASPVRRDSGALGRWFSSCQAIYKEFKIPDGLDSDTSVAQPAIVAASLAGIAALDELGIQADFGLGHSVGEVAALCWAGALSPEATIRIALERGRSMAYAPRGSMANINAPLDELTRLCHTSDVEIAAINAPKQIVISGESTAVTQAAQTARERGFRVIMLPVSHAFHSRSMAGVTEPLRRCLAQEDIRPLKGRVYSTVTGDRLPSDVDLRDLLLRQVTECVEFEQALSQSAASNADLLIEVGPGSLLSGIARESTSIPVVSLDACSRSHLGLLNVTAAAFVMGAPVKTNKLFETRYTKTFHIGQARRFLANPCEAPASSSVAHLSAPSKCARPANPPHALPPPLNEDPLTPVEVICRLVAQMTELPLSTIQKTDKMLDDLRLNSIVVAELAARAAQQLGRAPLVTPTHFSNATLEQLAEALMQEQISGSAAQVEPVFGLSNWVRCFATEFVPEPLANTRLRLQSGGHWTIRIPWEHPLRASLEKAFSHQGEGTVLYLSAEEHDASTAAILDAVGRLQPTQRLVVINQGSPCSAFLRSVLAERPDLAICLLRIPLAEQFCRIAYAEAMAAKGFVEVVYDEEGCRRVPRLQVVPVAESIDLPLSGDDVLLVSGGAKGIGAECALYLARQSKARLLLMGRSSLADDAEASRNAIRFSAAGIPFIYVQCDVTDRRQVQEVLSSKQALLGNITAVLHAAGQNSPTSIAALTQEHINATVAPKLTGLENILKALDRDSLRLCISFGSIIGRMGMRGNADYALANELMRHRMEQLNSHYPMCRFLTLEWSLWSGVGMAERLGSVETFARQGLTAISPEQGTRILGQVLSTRQLPESLIVAGQFRSLPGLQFVEARPPLLRFLEHIVKFIPGVELIAEAVLSSDTDPYLLDHKLNNTTLFPAVLGMEAMAQAASSLGVSLEAISWENLAFDYPIIVSDSAPTTIRLYAIKEMDGSVRISIRSQATSFQLDHFGGVIRAIDKHVAPVIEPVGVDANPATPAHTAEDVYGTILFQTGRFRRIKSYERLTSTSCRVRIGNSAQPWFGPYMPPTLTMGDPGLRDAAMHAVQACIPTHTIVPLGVKEIRSWSKADGAEFLVQACERSHSGNTFVYDIDILSSQGILIEQWRGIVLSRVESIETRSVQSTLLLGPYLERRLADLVSPESTAFSIEIGSGSSDSRSVSLLQRVAGSQATLLRRADGKPELFFEQLPRHSRFVSASHTEGLKIAVHSDVPVGCDVEVVQTRDKSLWAALLGPQRFQYCEYLASTTTYEFNEIATRLWCIKEALIKSGFDEPGLLRMIHNSSDGWLTLESGDSSLLSWSVELSGSHIAIALAFANHPVPRLLAAATQSMSLEGVRS